MIYLIQVDYSRFHSENIMPVGLLHVGSALKNAGYDVRIVHCTEKNMKEHADRIVREKPTWIGFSVMTGPQTLHSALMSKEIKKQSNIPIVWGGVHPSLLPAQCLREDYMDVVVIGEGEDSAIELSGRLEAGDDLDGVAGTGFKSRTGQIVLNPQRPFIEDLDDDRYRLDFELLDIPKYYIEGGRGKYKRMVSYKASRGCPFNCGFCYNNSFNRRKWRAKSAESVIRDIEYLKRNYAIDAVDFYDDEFYIKRDRALKILEAIDLPTKTDIRIDMITDDFARELKRLKVFSLLVGLESGSERILKLINKGLTLAEIRKGVDILARHDIRVVYSAIVGIPTETRDELNATIDLLLWIHSIHQHIVVTVGPYLPYPGSALYDWTRENGFVPPEKTEDWGNIDRWSRELRLPWVKDEYYFYIREYMKFFNYNVPLLSMLAEFRLKNRFLSFPIDAAIIQYLYEQAMSNHGGLGRLVRRIHGVVREV